MADLFGDPAEMDRLRLEKHGWERIPYPTASGDQKWVWRHPKTLVAHTEEEAIRIMETELGDGSRTVV